MPPTGNQAQLARRYLEDMDLQSDPWVINQLIEAINGTYGLRFRLTGYNHATNYAVEITNLDGTNGRALLIVDDAGNDLLKISKNLIELAVDGTGADVNIAQTTGNVGIGNVDADNTDIFMGGSGSYIGIEGGNIDFTTGGYFHINGVTPYSSANPAPDAIEKVNYTGNGSTGGGGRQITCGFAPEYAIVSTNNVADADVTQYNIYSSVGATRLTNSSNINGTTAVRLHGSDGIIVGDGVNHANVSGRAYTFIAFR